MRYIEYKFQNKKSHTPMERGLIMNRDSLITLRL